MTIYIVDDNHDLVEFIGSVLEEVGYKTHIFTHPLDVIAHIKTQKVQPRILITDYNLPAMNGYELHRNANALVPELKTLVISGRNVVADIKGLPFLQKPFSPMDLIQQVRAMQDQ